MPDLSDVGDLMWIEAELAKPKIGSSRRSALEALRAKGLAGKLTQNEVRKLREPGNTRRSGLKQLISGLRSARRRAAALSDVSPEALVHLDAAIQILANEEIVKVAGLDRLDRLPGEKWRGEFVA